MNKLSSGQLIALQSLWTQHARHSLDVGADGRAERLKWASEQCKRTVASFSDLSKAEARSLIELLAKSLGQADKRKPRRMRNRDAAQAAGTEGRGGHSASTTLVSADDLARIEDGLTRLGWTRERFDTWLRSSSSPLAHRYGGTRIAPAEPRIRTLGDANKVWWSLKAMLKRAGQWKD